MFNSSRTRLPSKVLFLNHAGQISGAEVTLLMILQRLDRKQFYPVLVCPKDTPLWEAASKIAGLELVHLEQFKFSSRLGLNTVLAIVQSAWQVFRVLERQGPAVVHANSVRSGLICGLVRWLLWLRLKPVPKLAVHVHDILQSGLLNLVIRVVLTATSSALLTTSDYVQHKARLSFWSRKGLFYKVPSGIDLSRFDPSHITTEEVQQMRARLGLVESDYPVIGVVAQMTPWKGQLEVIQAMPELLQACPSARLLMVGEPKFTTKAARYDTKAYYNSLKMTAAELGISDKIVFTGQIKEIPVLMAALDIFTLCSWAEPWGLVYLEAMAMERPVVATAAGGPAEIVVQNQTGFKVPPHDVPAISRALLQLASDPEAARQMGWRGRKRVQELYTIEQQTRLLEQIYGELIASPDFLLRDRELSGAWGSRKV